MLTVIFSDSVGIKQLFKNKGENTFSNHTGINLICAVLILL